jgi:hypothetical protein
MDRNRKIYVHGSGEHINVDMDFKRFSLLLETPAFRFLVCVFLLSTSTKLKFVMTRLARPFSTSHSPTQCRNLYDGKIPYGFWLERRNLKV